MSSKPGQPVAEGDFIESPVFKLLLVSNLLARPFLERIGPEWDLTLPEWRCLVALHARRELSNVEVAEATGLDPMSVSRALDRLQRKARIERARDPVDGRRQVNRMTTAGRSVYRAVVKLALRRQGEMFEGLGGAEVAQFAATLAKIAARLQGA